MTDADYLDLALRTNPAFDTVGAREARRAMHSLRVALKPGGNANG